LSSPLRILVCGRIAGAAHQGGAAWAVLQYLLGLEDLGHEVRFVEPVGAGAQGSSGSAGGPADVAYAQGVLSRSGMSGPWSFLETPAGTPGTARSSKGRRRGVPGAFTTATGPTGAATSDLRARRRCNSGQ
jgi:hypothetical protein